jgi:hypothetical protein
MATRNLTGKFEEYRTAARARRPHHSSISISNGSSSSNSGSSGVTSSDGGRDPLLSSAHGGVHDIALGGLRHTLPPDWVNTVDRMQADLKKVGEHRMFITH